MSKTVNIQDVIDLLLMNREKEYKKSLSAECKYKSVIRSKHDAHVAFCDYLIECVKQLSSVQPEISYLDCSNAMLKMWMDNVVTDGEYNRIMDKLNKKHEEDMRGENE